jgi:hypothetical protein
MIPCDRGEAKLTAKDALAVERVRDLVARVEAVMGTAASSALAKGKFTLHMRYMTWSMAP